MSEAAYAIGIDLGTTHCALSYVDPMLSDAERVVQRVLPVPQLTALGHVEGKPLLPSFLYLPHASEVDPASLALPWNGAPSTIVGEHARERGAETPIRLVSSAKSWLCHPGVDRRAPILPADAPDEVAKVSPLEASVRYIEHLRDAWNHAFGDAPFTDQDVTITVPASFDPSARELTAEAARKAGIANFRLLEEPQAALYSWLAGTAGTWREQVSVGDVILVIDVGGGTSDFSLITVKEEAGQLSLHRVAVGDHILLGGDNMDLALAHVVRAKLETEGKKLDAWQMRSLSYGCRAAKEKILSDAGTDVVPVVVPSRGSKLIGGSLRTEVTRAEVTSNLLEGFFPRVGADDKPQTRARVGLTQLGLPYAHDPAVTRHLAAFLSRQREALHAEGAPVSRPTAVLFNGGVFKSPMLQGRILDVLDGWLAAGAAEPIRVLEGADADLAVARGAAYYGFARLRGGVKIRGGTAKAFYIGVEAAVPAVPGMEPPIQALCVAPFGMDEGAEAELPTMQVGLVVGEPVRFRFFGSNVRRDDAAGTMLDDWNDSELEELDAIEATLEGEGRRAGDVVPVHLRSHVTAIGTLEILAVPRDGGPPWKVEFDVRGQGAR